MDVIHKRRICYRFTLGIGCNPQGCLYAHDYVLGEYYRHVERQCRKASTPSEEPTTFKRAWRELAPLTVMSYEGGGQRTPASCGSAEGNRSLAKKGVDTDSDSSGGEKEGPNEHLPTGPTFY